MTMNQQSVTYDVQQLKVYAFASADLVGGSSPTYSPGVICQGVAEAQLAPDIVGNMLKGDGGQVISRFSRMDMMTLSVTYGRVGLDALAVMTGLGVVDLNPGLANEQAFWQLSMPNTMSFFKTEFQVINTDNGVGSINVQIFKGQLKSATFMDNKTDSFGQPKFDLEGIPLLSNGVIGQVNFWATQHALST